MTPGREGESLLESKGKRLIRLAALLMAAVVLVGGTALAAEGPVGKTSYAPVAGSEDFATVKEKMEKEKPAVMKRQMDLLAERYELANKPAPGVTMARGKAVQEGVRVKLPARVNWQQLAAMSPAEIRDKGLFPKGFLPLPHPNHPEGGMLFPKFHIDEIKKQTGRDLARFDLDFDVPDHFLAEFPPPIFLTTRTDLGDVSQGKRKKSPHFSATSPEISHRLSTPSCRQTRERHLGRCCNPFHPCTKKRGRTLPLPLSQPPQNQGQGSVQPQSLQELEQTGIERLRPL
jgi:hypothetical protein